MITYMYDSKQTNLRYYRHCYFLISMNNFNTWILVKCDNILIYVVLIVDVIVVDMSTFSNAGQFTQSNCFLFLSSMALPQTDRDKLQPTWIFALFWYLFCIFIHNQTDMCVCVSVYPDSCKTSTGARLDPAVRPPLSQPIMITLSLLLAPCFISTHTGEIRPF